MRARVVAALLVSLAAVASAAGPGSGLVHRMWVRDASPSGTDLAALRDAGVDGFVVPVGSANVDKGSTTFTSITHADLTVFSPQPVTVAVEVAGEGEARGDASSFWSQLAPSTRGLPATGAVILVARRFWRGLPGFGAALAKESGHPVELMVEAVELARAVPPGGWPGISLLAVALGEADGYGFSSELIDDDLSALDTLDSRNVTYRVAVVVMPRISPPPGSDHVNLRPLASPQTASYGLGDADRFTLRRTIDWGGRSAGSGETIALKLVNTGRYARDLGLLLRPVHPGLRGWDTVMLPPSEPTAGMSRAALLDFLHGNLPYPRPQIEARWLGASRLEISVHNDTPHETGIGPTGNWVELRFRGAEVLDVQLGDFVSMEWGAAGAGVFKKVTAPRGANALRFHYLFLPPHDFIGGAVVTFVSRPSEARARWGVLPGDGSAVIGSWIPIPMSGR